MPSRRGQAVYKRNVRRIRTICENAEHFLASFFQPSGGASPSLTGYARILQQVHFLRLEPEGKGKDPSTRPVGLAQDDMLGGGPRERRTWRRGRLEDPSTRPVGQSQERRTLPARRDAREAMTCGGRAAGETDMEQGRDWKILRLARGAKPGTSHASRASGCSRSHDMWGAGCGRDGRGAGGGWKILRLARWAKPGTSHASSASGCSRSHDRKTAPGADVLPGL